MRFRMDIFFLFFKYSQCKVDKEDGGATKIKTTSPDANSKDAPIPDSSGDSNIPLEDLIILFILIFFGITFLYFFIRHLLRIRRRQVPLKDTKASSEMRRQRFGRIRKNSRGKPWFYPLDPLPKPSKPTESTLNDHDADNLIQSDISTESTLNLHDPFGVSTASSAKTKSSWFEMTDFVGVASAAILSLLFILILSSFEE